MPVTAWLFVVGLVWPSAALSAPRRPGSPPEGAGPGRNDAIVVLDVEANGVPAAEAALLTGSIAQSLSQAFALRVITIAEVNQLATLHTDRRALSCENETCVGALTRAVAARWALRASLGRVGSPDGL